MSKRHPQPFRRLFVNQRGMMRTGPLSTISGISLLNNLIGELNHRCLEGRFNQIGPPHLRVLLEAISQCELLTAP